MDNIIDDDEGRGIMMEGWLYRIRSNTIQFKYSQKLYYVLQNRRFKSFKSISHSYNQDPIRRAVVDSSIHVMDNGRKCIRGKIFFVFTLCDSSNYDVHVKLGASNSEEATRWIKSFQELSQKDDKNDVHDILSLASIMNPKTSDIYESSDWSIFACHNGLRLFKQKKYQECHNKKDHYPALAAVSVMEGTPEVIFQTLMSLGSSRSQWDFCFQKGNVIEKINGNTDIIHKQLNGGWLPWGMKRRDLLLHRSWRKEDNGTYIILYHSVRHSKCPSQKGFIRACVKYGGYVISSVNQYKHKQSVVKHMLAIDWKLWRSYLQKSSAHFLTIHMLGRLAALRELFKTNLDDYLLSEFSSQELKKDSLMHFTNVEPKSKENGEIMSKRRVGLVQSPDHSNFIKLDEESDEFFDFSTPLFDDGSEDSWATDNVIAEKKHEFVCELKLDTRLYSPMQKEDYVELETIVWDECVSRNYLITLQEDQTGNISHSWSTPELSSFQIRGETFLEDRSKITAENTLLQTIAVDWLKSDKREDHLAIRPGNIVQIYANDGRPEFFFVVNFQVPGSTTYHLASYFITRSPIKDIPLLERFIEGDDAFRNSRFKLIPHVSKGPWILRQTIRRPTLIGHMLKINYIRGKNYLEMDIDVGSSACARGVAGKTFSCFNNMIIDIAYIIQANTRDELPEHILGAFRVNHLDISKAVLANP